MRSTMMTAALVGFALTSSGGAAESDDTVEWRHYGGSRASTKYSPADQIDASKLAELAVAWRWQSKDDQIEAEVPALILRATPLVVGGRLFVISAYNVISALDPATGEEL